MKSLLLRIFLVVLVMLPSSAVLAQDDTESFTSSDHRVSFNYPSDWSTDESFPGLIQIGNDPSTFERIMNDTEDPLPDGSILTLIFTPSLTQMLFEGEQPESLQQVWEMYQAQAEEDDTTTISEPADISLGDHAALKISITSSTEEGVLIIIDFDGEYVIVSSRSPLGQFADYELLVEALLESLTYSIPEGPISFISENETLTLDYPGDWMALELMGTVAVSNDPLLLSRDSESPIESGLVMIFIFRPEVREFAAENLTDAVTQYAALTFEGEQLSEPAETTVGEHAAVRVDYQTELSEGYLLVVDFGGQYMYIQVQTAIDELENQEEMVLPILESIQYTPLSE